MGGSALTTPTRRVTKDEYATLVHYRLLPVLIKIFPNVRPTLALWEKQDFGDVDIVVSGHPKVENWREEVLKYLSTTGEHFQNSNCFSFECDSVQIDLIYYQWDVEAQWAHFYYSYNDMGNLIGRISRGLGFKYGGQGFYQEFRCPDIDEGFKKDILISRNPVEVLPFLGFTGLAGYGDNFDCIPMRARRSRREMFEFIESSFYFDPGYFVFENRNHEGRHRDKKRPTYLAFLEYLDQQYGEKKWPKPQPCKEVLMKRAHQKWPWLKQAQEDARKEALEAKALREAFSGGLIMELTGLEGPKLGQFIRHMRGCPVIVAECLKAAKDSEDHKAFLKGQYARWSYMNEPV